MSISDYDKECPLCMETLDWDDLSFFPCSCGYQICRFCWHRLRTDENGLCPACRQTFPDIPVSFNPVVSIEELKKQRKRNKERNKQQNGQPQIGQQNNSGTNSGNNNNINNNSNLNVSNGNYQHQNHSQQQVIKAQDLATLRVVQKNLVFVIGLSPRLTHDELKKEFAHFGKIIKFVHNKSTAYVTYSKPEEAIRAIRTLNASAAQESLMAQQQHVQLLQQLNSQHNQSASQAPISIATPMPSRLRASLGTTKYCNHFLKSQQCPKVGECMYLHEIADAEASFTKEQMQAGKHVEYEKKLMDFFISKYDSLSSMASLASMSNNTQRTATSTQPSILRPTGTTSAATSQSGTTQQMTLAQITMAQVAAQSLQSSSSPQQSSGSNSTSNSTPQPQTLAQALSMGQAKMAAGSTQGQVNKEQASPSSKPNESSSDAQGQQQKSIKSNANEVSAIQRSSTPTKDQATGQAIGKLSPRSISGGTSSMSPAAPSSLATPSSSLNQNNRNPNRSNSPNVSASNVVSFPLAGIVDDKVSGQNDLCNFASNSSGRLSANFVSQNTTAANENKIVGQQKDSSDILCGDDSEDDGLDFDPISVSANGLRDLLMESASALDQSLGPQFSSVSAAANRLMQIPNNLNLNVNCNFSEHQQLQFQQQQQNADRLAAALAAVAAAGDDTTLHALLAHTQVSQQHMQQQQQTNATLLNHLNSHSQLTSHLNAAGNLANLANLGNVAHITGHLNSQQYQSNNNNNRLNSNQNSTTGTQINGTTNNASSLSESAAFLTNGAINGLDFSSFGSLGGLGGVLGNNRLDGIGCIGGGANGSMAAAEVTWQNLKSLFPNVNITFGNNNSAPPGGATSVTSSPPGSLSNSTMTANSNFAAAVAGSTAAGGGQSNATQTTQANGPISSLYWGGRYTNWQT